MTSIAGSVDLDEALSELRQTRPVFHSEADFQHALAWQVHLADSLMQVRLETRPSRGMRLDLLFSRPDLQRSTAVEMKYLTALLRAEVAGESYELPNQGAQDVRAYDVVKDIARVEVFIAERPGWNGLMLALTNDQSYWNRPNHNRATGAAAFRLYEGVTLSGTRDWGPQSGPGTRKNREAAIPLRGNYTVSWRDFSDVGVAAGRFRTLAVEVA